MQCILYIVTNLVATHHTTAAHHPWTTTPIIHCTYDTHIPIHHCTNHTAVTNHSLTLIVSPHLHLIHTHTHIYISSTLPCTHREVLFSPVWHFRAVSPSVFPCCYLDCSHDSDHLLPALWYPLSAACPDHCIAPVDDSALPLCHLFSLLDSACLTSSCLSIKLQLDLTTLPLHYIHSEIMKYIMTKLDGQCIYYFYASHDRTIWYWNKKWFLYSSHLCIKLNSLCSD